MKRFANYTVPFLIIAACSSPISLAEPAADMESPTATTSPAPASTKDPSLILELGDLDEAPPAINPPQKITTKETPSVDNRMPTSVPSQPDPEIAETERSQQTISTTPTQAPPPTLTQESGASPPIEPLTAQAPAPTPEGTAPPPAVQPLAAQAPDPTPENTAPPLAVQPLAAQAPDPTPENTAPPPPVQQ